jgi:hypothetical protein
MLTPDSARWTEFCNSLIEALAPQVLDGDKISDGDLMFGCDNTLKHSEQILRAMGGIDVDLTLDYFEDHGGFCDCEVPFNVERSHTRPPEQCPDCGRIFGRKGRTARLHTEDVHYAPLLRDEVWLQLARADEILCEDCMRARACARGIELTPDSFKVGE